MCDELLYLYEIIKKDIINISHPIGSIYISTNNINPNVLFGGVWERVSGGCLYCSDDSEDIGTYGGSNKITVDNMPSHNHTFTGDNISGTVNARPYSNDTNNLFAATGCFRTQNNQPPSVGNRFSRSSATINTDKLFFNATPSGTISNTGEGTDYIPYHFKVSVWKRLE